MTMPPPKGSLVRINGPDDRFAGKLCWVRRAEARETGWLLLLVHLGSTWGCARWLEDTTLATPEELARSQLASLPGGQL